MKRKHNWRVLTIAATITILAVLAWQYLANVTNAAQLTKKLQQQSVELQNKLIELEKSKESSSKLIKERSKLLKEQKALQQQLQAKAQQRASTTVYAESITSDNTDVIALIYKWAGYYGVSADWLLRVGGCESHYNPTAINYNYYAGGGHPSGVFQFLPETFNRYSSRAGFNGYVFNANDNVRAAAYAFSVGGSGEWECK